MLNKNLMFVLGLVTFSLYLSALVSASETSKNKDDVRVDVVKKVTAQKEVKVVGDSVKVKAKAEIESLVKKVSIARKSDSENKDKEPENKQSKPKLIVNKGMNVAGDIKSQSIKVSDILIDGNAEISEETTADKLETNQITTETLSVEKIVSQNGVITLEGNLIINNNIHADTVGVKGSSFKMEGIKQWGLKHHNDFESEESLEGWSDKRTSRCNKMSGKFLGGQCNFAFTEASKTFKGLSKHSFLRVTAILHMLDKWNGEKAYMKINGKTVWSRVGKHSENKGLNICGGEFNDPEFALPINVVIPHSQEEVTVSFGSTLTGNACDQSFGVDDVTIYTK